MTLRLTDLFGSGSSRDTSSRVVLSHHKRQPQHISTITSSTNICRNISSKKYCQWNIVSFLLPASQLHIIFLLAELMHSTYNPQKSDLSSWLPATGCLLPLPETKLRLHAIYVAWAVLFIVPHCCFLWLKSSFNGEKKKEKIISCSCLLESLIHFISLFKLQRKHKFQ